MHRTGRVKIQFSFWNNISTKNSTSEKFVFEVRFTSFFISLKCHVLLWYSTCSIPNHSVNFKSCYGVMSISSRDRTHFRIYLWMVEHLGMIFDQLIDIIVVNIFQAYFAWPESLAPKSRPVSVYQHAKINQKLIMMTQ